MLLSPQESESLVQPRGGRGAQEERGRCLQVDICVALVVASEAALEVDVSFEVAIEVKVRTKDVAIATEPVSRSSLREWTHKL